MKKIVALFVLLTALLPIRAQGRELPPEYESDRTCYSADGTKIYRYYDDYMIARQANKNIPGDSLVTQPDWFSCSPEPIRLFCQERKDEFRTLGEKFQLGRGSIFMRIHVSLRTGQYAMSEIWLREKAVSLADQLPLDYLFSLFEGIKFNSRIMDHAPDNYDNKYMTFLCPIW